MSGNRRAARRDENEPGIVAAIRALGASVTLMPATGTAKGIPDLLVGYRGITEQWEIKVPRRADGAGQTRTGSGGRGELTGDQVAWWDSWHGATPRIIHSVAEAMAALEAMADASRRARSYCPIGVALQPVQPVPGKAPRARRGARR